MIRFFTLLVTCFIFLCPPAETVAQTSTATLGSGGSSSSTRGPFQRSSASSSSVYSRANMVYLASELSAVGIVPGAIISQISFDLNRTNIITAPSGNAFLDFYMKNSSAAAATSDSWTNLIAGSTPVGNFTFNITNNFPGATGWMAFPITPFVYTGGTLEIQVDWDCSGLVPANPAAPNQLFSGDGSLTWRWQPTSFVSLTNRAGSSGPPSTISNTKSERANIQIVYSIPVSPGVCIFNEDFDGSNTTNPPIFSEQCGDDNDYFDIVCQDMAGCPLEIRSDFVLNGASGQYFGVRDMDASPCSNSATKTLSFDDIDISSCCDVLYVCFDVAESRNIGGAAGAEWSTSNLREDTWDGNANMTLNASVDGATSIVTAIEAVDGSDTRPGIDTNCDGKADDPGEPLLTETFTTYCFELPTGGSLLDLEFEVNNLNTQGEDLAIDNIKVSCGGGVAGGTTLSSCTPYVSNLSIWREDFDGSNTTNPFSLVLPSLCDADASRDYLGIVCMAGTGCTDEINSDYIYTGISGQFLGARDMDGNSFPTTNPTACEGSIDETFNSTGIDISSCTDNLYICVDLAESFMDRGNSDSWDGNSAVTFLGSVDGGASFPLAAIADTGGSNSGAGIDTDCDGLADGVALTENMETFCFEIPVTGSTLDLDIRFEGLNTDGEDIAIDNISLICTDDPTCLPTATVTPSCPVVIPTLSQTDPGDGSPSILDPCSCTDPLNEVVGGVLYFHDFITIFSGPGETWTISNITAGQMYVTAGGALFAAGDPLPETAPGVYHIDFWTPAGVGFAAEFNSPASIIPLQAGGTCDDTVAPTAICQDITVQLDATGNVTILPSQIDNGSTDDCLPVTVTLSLNQTTFDCDDIGPNTVTLTVTDLSGNTDDCMATVTVEDVLGPTVMCQDVTVQLDPDGNGTLTAEEVNNGSVDPCSSVTLSIDNTDYSCVNIGSNNTVTLTATDASGNTSSCTATVTVEDTVPPVITCPSDQTFHLDPGACEYIYSYEVTAEDNCEFMLTTTFLSTTLADNNGFAGNMFDVSAVGATAVGINSFDMNLDVLGASVDVSVWYTTSATTYQGNETNAGAWTLLGSATVVSQGAGNATTVPIGGLTLAPGDAKGIYVATTNGNFMQYTNGNGANQNYSDANLSIETGIGRGGPAPFTGGIFNPRVWNGNIHYSFLAPAAPLVALSAGLGSGVGYPIGTTTNTHTATDGQGNTSSCSFSVTVVEYVPSSFDITCNNLVHISLDENCQAVVGADQVLEGSNYGCYDNYPVTFVDGPNQGQPVVLDGSHIGQTINYMVTNPQGNPCWGQILVEDKLIPDLVCTDVSVRCDEPTAPGASIAATLDYSFPTVTSIDNATVTETVTVGAGDEVVDLDVTISTNHTWIGDVDMTITSPSGTVVTLFDRPGVPATAFGCNNTVDMNFSFDDDAVKTATDMENDCPPDGPYQPIDPLATFNGEPAQGTWTVSIMDSAAPDAGDFDITLNLKSTNSGTIAYPVPATATVTPAGNNTFTVIGFDPCGPATLTYTDAGSGDACAGTQIITRDWSIVDGYGNTSSCTQTISIQPTTLADVASELPADITLECGDALPAPITSVGTCDNIAIALDGAPSIIDICGNGFKMLRKYVVVDWCTNETMEHIQLIKVEDTTDPVITCPADLTVSTSSNSCNGNVALIMPTWTDCGGGVTFSMTASAGTISGNILTGLPIGEHTVTFTGTDACGNSTDCTQKITVQDDVSPTAVCDEHTVVALGSDGTALVNAVTFDDGSNDNCGIVLMEAQRMDNPNCPGFDGTSFDATVPFYCCDVGSVVMVAFRVTDAAGNTNTCMVEVEVQDKMNPTIVCKPDLTISCDNPIIADIQVGQPLPASAIGLTGTPAVTDNCNATISSNVILNTIDNCGNGEIKIAWSAVDGAGNFDGCFQSIFITDSNPFDGNSIVWPQDYTANTCGLGLEPEDLPTANAYPTWNEGTCSNVASTHEDTQLSFGADNACLKILRKWIIIDWCAVPAGADPTDPNTAGVWHYTQVIKVLNSTAPVIETFNGATTIDNFDENCGGVFVAFDITASDDCTPSNLLSYSWEFSTGTSGSGTSAAATFVNGTYSVSFTVSDQCGNSSTDSRTFTVADKKKPTPVCIFGIASTVMPSAQQVTIWASDFESGSSYDNCTAYNNLIFSFSPVVPGQPIDDNLVITCGDVPSDGLVPVTLYVTDAAGNYDFCTTFINVQDPNGACPGPNTIFGSVQTEDQEMVEDVMVTVEDNNGPMPTIIPVVTGVNGTFSFNTNGMANATYDIIAEKDINYLNGVTTYDLVLISKHILGIELLDSPYKIIAADANHTETVTTLDIVKLRALILHIDDELSNNTSWRFVDANYTFNNPNNPLAESFPEYVEAVPNSAVPSNFTGIKIGDVNATASPNSLLGTETRTMNGELALQAKATAVAKGETFTIDFTAKDFNNIAGYQFTLGFDNNAVEFVDVTSNLEGLTSNNFGLTKTGEGVITTSWNSSKGVSVENNEVLFSVTFVANADVNTQDVININSRYTESEAYNGDDLFDVVLEFNGTATANGFELYQNTPNPFKAETMIGFNLPEAGEVTLKIFDVSGRILRLIEMDAAKGYNSVDVNRAGIDATGVLYYQLETATETATKKMIIVD